MQTASPSDWALTLPQAFAQHAVRLHWRSLNHRARVASRRAPSALRPLSRCFADPATLFRQSRPRSRQFRRELRAARFVARGIALPLRLDHSFAEIADLWAVAERTVQRDWDKARVLLNRLISEQPVA